MGKEQTKLIQNAMKKIASAAKQNAAAKNTNTASKKRKPAVQKKRAAKATILDSFSPRREKQNLPVFDAKKALKEIRNESEGRRQRVNRGKPGEAKGDALSAAVKNAVGSMKKTAPKAVAVKTKTEESKGLLPVSGFRISSRFGVDRGTHRHSGIDLALPEGSAVASVKSGKIVYAGWSNGYGYRVVVNHGDGTETTYNHLSDIGVEVGDEVKAGTQIARSGNTGHSTGPHLHFEVSVGGKYVNPESYYDFGNGIAPADSGDYTSKLSVAKRKNTGSTSSKTGKSGKATTAKKQVKSLTLPSPASSVMNDHFDAKAYLAQMIADQSFSRRKGSGEKDVPLTHNPLMELIPAYRQGKLKQTGRTGKTKRT